MSESWYSIFGIIWSHVDIHITPTIWAIGILYDNRRVTTRYSDGKGIHILLGPVIIRVYLSYKPEWRKWKERK
jgi:hypothetical protein